MKKNGSQDKARIAPVGVAAVLGMAGMGLVSGGVVMADVTSITDTLSVAVNETCTFKNTSDAEFAGSALNGNEVENFNDSGVHTFYLFCNNNDGYTVSATPYDLEAKNTEDVISYTDNYTHTGKDGMWTAEIASSASGVTAISPVPVGGGVVLSSGTSSSDSMSFTATYRAYVGTETPAGAYTGTIVYTLTASGTSNSVDNGGDNSGSGDNGDSGTGEKTGGGSENGGNSETGGGSDANSGDSSNTPTNTPANTQNAAPKAVNNIYNSYSTTNTYNTTNYSGGSSASTPALASTQGVTSGDSDGDNSEASNSFEKPLGVTTKTDAPTSSSSFSNEGSGVDPLPLIAAGAALAAAGVAAVAVARSDKKEE